ncbi:MAG: hypothetical protein D6679_08150 [Candidatus Hydrogenedentota bacterium]|nr:MAG: hypothetical protein D6679_08150 [Candidatus Hydrogenedentota bacterium]
MRRASRIEPITPLLKRDTRPRSARAAPMFLVLVLLLVASAPARAGFVTVAQYAGPPSGFAVAGGFVYAARSNVPSVLVYSATKGTLLREIGLAVVSAIETAPTGVTALAADEDGTVFVGTAPAGEVFAISQLKPFSLGRADDLPGGAHPDSITALFPSSDGRLYFGPQADIDTTTILFRSAKTSLSSAEPIALLDDSLPVRVTTLAGTTGLVFVGTGDSPAGISGGRAHLLHTASKKIVRVFLGDSFVTSAVARPDSLFFATSPRGRVYDLSGNLRFTVAETAVHAMLYANDGNESVTFLGSETGLLRRWHNDGSVDTVGMVDPNAASIVGLGFVREPERIFGVAVSAVNGGGIVFYYDAVAPWVTNVDISIDPSLKQPSTPEPFPPRITWGQYTFTITTNEPLNGLPTVNLRYPDNSLQQIPMAGADTTFSGTITIDKSRPAGTVTLVFVGVDDAGNTGTTIVKESTFTLESFGQVRIANNLIRPAYGEFATIRYVLNSPQNVAIRVFNMRGLLVADLSPGFRGPGQHQDVTWDGRNMRGEKVASGVYLVRIEAGTEIQATFRVMVIQ